MGLLENQESVFGCTDQKDEKGSVGETPFIDSRTRASKLETKVGAITTPDITIN